MGEKQGHTGWKAECGFHRCGTGLPCSVRITSGTIKVKTEDEARLIAAAPDLLAAVWALVEHFERVDGDASHKAVIKQATDAIGRATNRPRPTGEDSPANEGLA